MLKMAGIILVYFLLEGRAFDILKDLCDFAGTFGKRLEKMQGFQPPNFWKHLAAPTSRHNN
jgi:hypothetical protein